MRVRWLVKGYAFGFKSAAPKTSDIDYPIPFIWINTLTDIAYILSSKLDDDAIWSVKPPDLIINEGEVGQINVIGETNLFETSPGSPLSVIDYTKIETQIEADLLSNTSYSKEFSFAWGDASPAVLEPMVVGKLILDISVVIFEVFDGIGAALSIGIDGIPGMFMTTDQCDPTELGTYSVSPSFRCTGTNIIKLFITPGAGASTGNGKVIIEY